ncbi:MAG: hypothetical protein IKE66_06360 [Hyphomicrobium sp.]|nr:hypothetical protein [Hyphomicrobium sp.]
MATDYAGKEKEFVASLGPDTGRDLEGWMQAISGAGLAHRNDIIDWLRQNGFTFANASWLERIHHNGGRLIYGNDEPAIERTEARPQKAAIKTAPPVIPNVTVAIPRVATQNSGAPVSGPPKLSIVATSPGIVFDPAVSELLLTAKGLRPLAVVALQEIAAAVPGAALTADGPLIMMSAPKPFLALLPGAKALRFYGRFERDGSGRVARAEPAMKTPDKAPPPFPGVVVLADARLVDDAFAAIVKQAHTSAHA